MRYALIKNGIVENVIEADSIDFMPGLVAADEHAEIGATYANGVFTRAPAAPPSPSMVLAALRQIDLDSIRVMREWLAKRPDAPPSIKDLEAAAIAARAKL